MTIRACLFALTLSGCFMNALASWHPVDAYRDYYVDKLGGRPVSSFAQLAPPDGQTLIFHGANLAADNREAQRKGYLEIGYSTFEANDMTVAMSESLARTVAAERGAALVMMYDSSAGQSTELVDRQIDDPEVTTWTRTDREGNDHVHTRETDNYTTVQDTVVNDRTSYTATFWAKEKPPVLGVLMTELPAEQRAAVGGGVAVDVVIEGSPAERAGVMPGDVLTMLGTQQITGRTELQQRVAQLAGSTVDFTALRAGQLLHLAVALGGAPMVQAVTSAAFGGPAGRGRVAACCSSRSVLADVCPIWSGATTRAPRCWSTRTSSNSIATRR